MTYNRDYYLKDKVKWHARANRWRKANPDRIKFSSFKSRLKLNYNLDYSVYLEMLKAQNNCCALCNSEDKLVVDHCHTTSKVRGLLCQNCNKGLGFLKDNIELMYKAINYLNDTKN